MFFPKSKDGSIPGSKILASLPSTAGRDRDVEIAKHVLAGHVPDYLNNPISIVFSFQGTEIGVLAMPDVLSIGNNTDYVRVSLAPRSMQALAEMLGLSLITPKISDEIWKRSQKAEPIPEPWYQVDGGKAMLYTSNLGVHSKAIDAQLSAMGFDPSKGVAGIKKDVVLTSKLSAHPGKAAIYGWHKPNGKVIQDLNVTSHEDTYQDYSQGVRYIYGTATVNGKGVSVRDVLADPALAPIIADGVITTYYPTKWPAGGGSPSPPPVIKPPPPPPVIKPPPVVNPPPPGPSGGSDDSGMTQVLMFGAAIAAIYLFSKKR
jgi:hypothetical protein